VELVLGNIIKEIYHNSEDYVTIVIRTVVSTQHGYQSGVRCRLAYGPADATATHCLLLQ